MSSSSSSPSSSSLSPPPPPPPPPPAAIIVDNNNVVAVGNHKKRADHKQQRLGHHYHRLNGKSSSSSSASVTEVKKRYIWSDRETEHFIRLIIDMGMTNMLDSKRKRNSDLYSSLVEPMAAAGFNRDATQLRTKWKHLKQDYKVELARIERNGAASSRISYFHLLHEVLSCKPRNAMTYLCEVVSSSPPSPPPSLPLPLPLRPGGVAAAAKAAAAAAGQYCCPEYEGGGGGGYDVKTEPDFYAAAEPQVDIIQSSDAQTQTSCTPEQQVLRRLQALEAAVSGLRDDMRRDRETRQSVADRHVKRILDGQRALVDEFLAAAAAAGAKR